MELLKPCIEPLLSFLQVRQHVEYLLHSKKNVEDMNQSMQLLSAKKRDVEKELKDAADRNKLQPTEEAKLWLGKVEKLEAEVPAVNEDYEQIGRRHPLHNVILPNLYPFIHSCGRRAANLKDEAAKLLEERAGITDLTTPMGSDPVQGIAGPSSYVGKAIGQNLERIRGHLQDETVGAIGIWGPGGVGKTTLLGRINNSLKGDGNLGFDHVIWVVGSQPLQLDKLRKEIAESLKLQSPSEIFDSLENRNFLLLIDDLWEDFNLNDIGIPQPLRNSDESKQKVILTTRSEGVCSSMQVNKKIRVECLERDEALQLFREKVGERIISNPEIKTLAKEVAEECDGLPIALITVGKAMSNKRTEREWRDALRKLQSDTGAIRGMDRVFSRLKISYDSLEDDTEKECFLYCSLWPEDCWIEKEELIWCWLGHGLIDLERFDNLEGAFDRGHSIFGNLKEACLLEASPWWRKDTIKMHDIIRDLAVWVVGENKWKWIVKTFNNAEDAKQTVAKWKDADKAYFEIEAYEDGDLIVQPPQCSKLSTLILKCSRGCVNADFLCLLPALRYLDLSVTSIRELPAVIGCLSQLEYLRIHSEEISEGLPDELANLPKLKYFIFDGPVWIPPRVIFKLRKLLVLVARRVVQTNEDPTKEDDVEEFSRALRRMKFVEIEELKISLLGALELPSHVEVSTHHISNLTLQTFHPQILSNVKRQIKSLEISNCVALEEFVMDSSCLPRLRSLTLKKLPKLRKIIRSGVPELPRLDVEVIDCPEFEKARKNRRPASSGGAGSSGTENTVGPSNSPPSTLSTHTPGDGVSMAGDLQHISSMPKSLIKYDTDGTRGLATSSNQMDDSEYFGDVGSLDDNVESFMSHDDEEALRRGPAEHNTDSSKGFTFAEVGCMISRNNRIGCCNFSSDGKVLAYGGEERKVVLCNMDNMQTESSWEQHSDEVTDICFRPNSTELATSSEDGTVRLWNAAEPTFYLHEFTGHGTLVRSLDFHPKKTELLCSCDSQGEIRMWDVDQLLCSRVSKVEGNISWCVRFQPRIGQLLAAAIDNEVSIIDVETDMETWSLQQEVDGVCWDANGDYLASVSQDCVKVWSLTSGECIHELSSSIGDEFWSCVFHPRYPELLVVGGHKLWNMAENRTMLTVQAHDAGIAGLAQTPFGGGTVASASHDNTVKIWR